MDHKISFSNKVHIKEVKVLLMLKYLWTFKNFFHIFLIKYSIIILKIYLQFEFVPSCLTVYFTIKFSISKRGVLLLVTFT